jgi:hypothetical protein
MIYPPPNMKFSGKIAIIEPKAELINSNKVVPLDAWTYASVIRSRSKPQTLLEKLEVYYESNCSRK